MNLPTATLDDVLSWNPCWDEDKVRRIAARQERWTALDVLWLRIPAADRLWVVLREPFMTTAQLRLFAADCAVRALIREREAGREPDPRSWEAVRVARDYALGLSSDEELAAARAAAWAAAGAAAGAARAAARAAAWAVAWAAAGDAAWDAAGAAAWDAGDDAWDAERKKQIKRLMALIRSGVGS